MKSSDENDARSRFAPSLPRSGSESTTALVHYNRAEMSRLNAWRSRLDLTTNWAITVVAAMLSVTLSTPTAHHGLVLFAMVIVSLLLGVEARRYRFFDVYRMRVRQFERHYFGQYFGPDTNADPGPWLEMLAQDLRHPKFRINFWRSMGRRLRRNYIWMYLILLVAWVLKIASPDLQTGVHLDPQRPFAALVAQASTGPIPGWLVVCLVSLFFLGLLFATYSTRERGGDEVRV
nr:DUF2270 domain-containing protein [uncultured Devosia sp.]